MRYLNAAQAAKRLNIGDKTIRRWLAAGKYFPGALKKANGEYAIPENEVEELRIHRASFTEQETGHDRSTEDTDFLIAKIAALEQEVSTLRERIALLEQSKSLPVGISTSRDIDQLSTRAQKRIVARNREVPPDLPSGTLSASDFAAKIGIAYDDLKNYMRRGVYGEKLDVTEVPHPSRTGYVQKFFSPGQQEAAYTLLIKHGKIAIQE